MKKAVIGIVPTRIQAEAIVSELRSVGIASNDISVLLPDQRGTQEFAHDRGTKAPEGAATGAGAGGLLGGVLGVLAGIGALAIPGLGPFIAAGPIMAALSGAAVGAAVGGVAGALVGMGIPEYEAKLYEKKLRDGNILLAVHTENGEERSRAIETFKRIGVADVTTKTETAVSANEAREPRSR